jgi:GAF domain-containing protein/anti-sigma regulatory factor (Ser/Thr protein kinase)
MGMTWTAVSTGQTIAVSDITKDERVNPAMAEEKGVRAIIGTPLKVEEETIGVLFLNDFEPHEFTEYEKELLSTLASHAAIAIQNTSLLKQERQRADAMALLQQVSAKISASLNVEETLALIIEGAMQLTGTNSGVIHLVDETQPAGIRSHELPKDFGHLPPRFSEKEGLTWTIVDTGQVLTVSDISKDDRVNPEMIEKGVKAIIGVPLVVEGATIGALFLNDSKVREFSEYEKGPLSALAGRAAIAIKNSQLFENYEDRMDDLSALSRISRGLSSKEPLTVRDMSLLLHEEARDLMDLSNFYVASYDKGLDLVTFELAVEKGKEVKTGSGEWAHRVGGNGLTEQVVKRGELLYIPSDVGKWREEHGAYDGLRDGMSWGEWMESRDPIVTGQSWLGLPIRVGDEILGVIGVQNYEKADAYDEYDQKVLSTVAAQLGIAIVRQYLDRGNRELEVLTEIGRTVSNLGIDQILDLVYEQMSKVIDLSDAQVQIAFYDEAKDEVSFPLAVEQDAGKTIDIVRWSEREAYYMKPGEDEIVEQFKPRRRRDPPGLNEYVIRTKHPLLIVEDFEQKAADLGIKVWPTFGRLDRPTHSWLGVPMMVADRVIGVISIQSLEQKRAFDVGHQQLLATVASQAAVAIENARLYQELSEKIGELERAQNRIAEAEAVATRMSIAADFVHRLRNLAGTIPIWVDEIREHLGGEVLDDEDLASYLTRIESDAKRLLGAAEQLESPPGAQDIDPQSVLEPLVRQALIQTPAAVEIDLECKAKLPRVRVVPSELTNALWNIVENGIDAMPEGGTLTITAESLRDAVGRDWVRIRISDQGKGISNEEVDRVFSPFYSTKAGHTGYGLWRARNIVERVGGSIDLEISEGPGATFTVRLPSSKEANSNEQ